MYYVYALEDDKQLEVDRSENRHSACMQCKGYVLEHGGIAVVEDVEGSIVYEALNDGIEIVTVSKPLIMELVGV